MNRIFNVAGPCDPEWHYTRPAWTRATLTTHCRPLSWEDIAALYGQHTSETGQIFESGAVDAVWEKTQGQPWLNVYGC